MISALSKVKIFLCLGMACLGVLTALYLSENQVGAGEKESPKIYLVPPVFLTWPEKGPEHAIVVDKSLQKIYIYEKGAPPKCIRTYSCSTGENDGPKLKKNDKKTPEGIYFITKSFVERELSPIYGVRAFPLDYPNSLDLREGREGYGIWFHGTNKPLKPNDSNGCIVLENDDIEEMASYIKLQETPVIILGKMVMVSQNKIEQKKKQLEATIEEWRQAWEKKDVKRYVSFYNPIFSSGGRNWQEWKAYKTRLAETYPYISVKVDDLLLLVNGDTALASFTQDYKTASLSSNGLKRLYLKSNSDEWKIMAENFYGTDISRPVAVAKRPSPQAEIGSFIQSWKRAWERKNLLAYIACYDPSFKSRDMDLKAWRQHRARLNRQYRSLNIAVSQVNINLVSDHRAEVTFIQDYRADHYRDYGLKKMVLIKKGEDWKIRSEEWSPLKR